MLTACPAKLGTRCLSTPSVFIQERCNSPLLRARRDEHGSKQSSLADNQKSFSGLLPLIRVTNSDCDLRDSQKFSEIRDSKERLTMPAVAPGAHPLCLRRARSQENPRQLGGCGKQFYSPRLSRKTVLNTSITTDIFRKQGEKVLSFERENSDEADAQTSSDPAEKKAASSFYLGDSVESLESREERYSLSSAGSSRQTESLESQSDRNSLSSGGSSRNQSQMDRADSAKTEQYGNRPITDSHYEGHRLQECENLNDS
ncbi:uncharacterized protein LOC106151116 [Lingula anatina]|uniref:Uncharacterized protein LOC106151116 n=1 Tax=Lingula anatina TaxID=7574 RepID=A0A1S3H153_LINAN|nr:uncharacterized protein LOC106151116 [Lingula anatina]|eukprot:XP_013379667.1 uncharacterized protein LOC106151116 [Lingula anatina]